MTEPRPLISSPASSLTVQKDEEAGLLFVKRQNLEPVLRENEIARAAFDRHAARRLPAKMRRVAQIPHVIVAHLRERGIWGDEKKLRAWLSSNENRVFRTDDGGQL